MLLDTIANPSDLRALSHEQLVALSGEIRARLIDTVSETGGHLGPNLGMVEVTLAMHRVFASPTDSFVFDTGHQAYVHKLLTGRGDRFSSLRQIDGMSGYPSRAESQHDIVENSHASTGLSYGLALATARRMQKAPGTTVCVVGDGSLTGGMAYEALNNIGAMRPDLIIVLNDNGRSYAPTIGGMARHLGQLRLSPRYAAAKEAASTGLGHLPLVGDQAVNAARRMKESLKQLVVSPSMFETLGIKYGGPIDGHDIRALERAFHDAKELGGPVVVHVVTDKGHGYAPAVDDEIDKFHGVGAFDPTSGRAHSTTSSWTDVFEESLLDIAKEDERVVAITAAMASSTGLIEFSHRYPGRFFDVGIAEQHAVTFAAGLAMRGLRPIVCIYSTFLSRAFDQLLYDVALHHLPVTFILDRAGVTGEDGSSHHGMFDLSYLRSIPTMTVVAPSFPSDMVPLLRSALSQDGPFAIRYPRGAPVTPPAHIKLPHANNFLVPSCRTLQEGPDLLIAAVGKMVPKGLEAVDLLKKEGIHATLIDARFIKPLAPDLLDAAAHAVAILTVEDGIARGGFGSALLEELSERMTSVPPLRRLGHPDHFLPHGAQAAVLERIGLTPQDIASAARRLVDTSAHAGVRVSQ